jgi:hypothetical protein
VPSVEPGRGEIADRAEPRGNRESVAAVHCPCLTVCPLSALRSGGATCIRDELTR